MKGRFYIQTYGCQMNKYDSEIVAGILQREGYLPAEKPEEANIILVNTCSVREHAENRALGYLNTLKVYKLRNDGVIIGVLGCMAQRLGYRILREKPFVDFIMGPDCYKKLPIVVEGLSLCKPQSRAFLNIGETETYSDVYPSRVKGVSAWVAIIRGCNNFCSYCVVPYLRGRERSRPAQSVLREVKRLVDEGFVEVTLLGQNVNSYKDGEVDFPDLLTQVAQVKGIKRIRFATSHPKDLSDKLIKVIAENPIICNHIHLPVQSGSNKILKLMNRRYTREDYLRLVERIKKGIEGVSLTTDIIVGFPGEREGDFQDTVKLVKEVEFDNAFIFKYSPREGTKAFKLKETLSEEEKVSRLQRLNMLQKEITLRKNKSLIGRRVEVLVEGPSKKSKRQLMGRTDTNKIVVFPEDHLMPGSLVNLKIVKAEGITLFGEGEEKSHVDR